MTRGGANEWTWERLCLEATMEAMHKSVKGLNQEADWVLIDGNRIPEPLKGKAEAIVKGDAKSVCIAAASVLAKVTRDRMMVEIAETYPQYGFAEHKGYGTKAHMAAWTCTRTSTQI